MGTWSCARKFPWQSQELYKTANSDICNLLRQARSTKVESERQISDLWGSASSRIERRTRRGNGIHWPLQWSSQKYGSHITEGYSCLEAEQSWQKFVALWWRLSSRIGNPSTKLIVLWRWRNKNCDFWFFARDAIKIEDKVWDRRWRKLFRKKGALVARYAWVNSWTFSNCEWYVPVWQSRSTNQPSGFRPS